MMKTVRIREQWGNGRAAMNSWLTLPSALTAEMVAQQGFDALTIDMQHGAIGYETALSMLQAIATTPATPLVRIPWLAPDMAMKMLDAGAWGIICPMINTPEEVEALVRYCHYPPAGERSFGPLRAETCYGADYPVLANDYVLPIAMIETREALANLDRILQVPGLGGVYIGPYDLSYALGCQPAPDTYEQPVLDAIGHILARAQHYNVPAGMHCLSAEYAVAMAQKGFQLVTAGSDSGWLQQGVQAAQCLLRKAGLA
ncbi:aldolase/citrate lyase family protein [Kistimonas scapharcae]|uniref:Aldolase/citrate lyase family protein n=1 Tax=Kistimonas scapharcae TaxID=1036133 RepID=A0ABP8V3B0_9GAMM